MPLYVVVLWVKHILNRSCFLASGGGHHPNFLEPFGATWAILGAFCPILGAIWDPAGRQGAPKIDLFGTKSHQNLKKWIPEWGIKKCMKIWLKFDEKNVLKPQNYYV